MKRRSCSSILVTTLFALAITAPVFAQEQSQIGDGMTGKTSAKQHLHYKLIDLGTFGGPLSYLATSNAVTLFGAINQVLNNHGTVVGWADTSAVDPFAPYCFNPFPGDCFLPVAFQRQKGVLTKLGVLPGGNASAAFWISDNGLIAGSASTGVVDPLLPLIAQVRAVLWKDGQIINLGTLGGNQSNALSVNNRGQVVGSATNTIPDPSSLYTTQLRAFLWQDDVMQDLGTLGGPDAIALFVNERGQVAGMATTNLSPSGGGGLCGLPLTTDPFLWENGKMTDLGTLGGTCGMPYALNNRGQIIGMSLLAGDLAAHPFLWERGSLIDLGTFGGSFGIAEGINDSGEVVGFATNKNDQAYLAFLWKDGVMTNLGTLNGDDCSYAFQINPKGQIVGISFPCAGGPARLVLWQNGFMTDLSVFAPPGSSLTPWGDGAVINDRGEIASLRVLPDGDLHAFMLVPCEEDTDGCVDAVEGTAATRSSMARPARSLTTSIQRRLTPAEMLAAWRARLAPQ
jgi:probable HAF family extracellular repeat protein